MKKRISALLLSIFLISTAFGAADRHVPVLPNQEPAKVSWWQSWKKVIIPTAIGLGLDFVFTSVETERKLWLDLGKGWTPQFIRSRKFSGLNFSPIGLLAGLLWGKKSLATSAKVVAGALVISPFVNSLLGGEKFVPFWMFWKKGFCHDYDGWVGGDCNDRYWLLNSPPPTDFVPDSVDVKENYKKTTWRFFGGLLEKVWTKEFPKEKLVKPTYSQLKKFFASNSFGAGFFKLMTGRLRGRLRNLLKMRQIVQLAVSVRLPAGGEREGNWLKEQALVKAFFVNLANVFGPKELDHFDLPESFQKEILVMAQQEGIKDKLLSFGSQELFGRIV